MSRETETSLQPLNPANHLKPDTIWHTVSRDDEPLDYDERYPSKKRRVSCGGIEIVKCNICGHHFDSPTQLSDHLLHHDNDYRYNPIYKCSYGQCIFRTDDRSLMKHHISRVHLKSDQALINKRYRNRRFLRPTILCNTCPMVFATESELWQHTPTCKEYRCQFCGQHFWTIEKRYSHELVYHEEEFEYEDEEEVGGEEEETNAEMDRTHDKHEETQSKEGEEEVVDEDRGKADEDRGKADEDRGNADEDSRKEEKERPVLATESEDVGVLSEERRSPGEDKSEDNANVTEESGNLTEEVADKAEDRGQTSMTVQDGTDTIQETEDTAEDNTNEGD